MVTIKCNQCGCNFSTYDKRRKYCSTTCYSLSKKGKSWGGALNTGKGSRGKYSDYQVNQMVKGKRVAYLSRVLDKYNNNQYPMNQIHDILNNCYVSNIRALVKLLYNKDDGALSKELKCLFNYLGIKINESYSVLPECYRTMNVEQSKWFKQILKDCTNFYDFSKKFELSYKTVNIRKSCRLYDNLIKFIQFTNFETKALNKNLSKNLSGCGSSCESIVRNILKSINCSFVEQGRLPHTTYKCIDEQKNRTSCLKPDFIVDNKFIIEVNGDYWHSYNIDVSDMNNQQFNRYKKDLEKYEFYRKNNYKFIIIWEHELVNIDYVKNKILKEVNNEVNYKRIIYK